MSRREANSAGAPNAIEYVMFAFARFPVRFVARFTYGTSAIFPVERYVLQQLGEAAGYAVLRSGQRAGLLPNKPVLRVSQAPERTRVSIARQQ
jgi:hypothetical protein